VIDERRVGDRREGQDGRQPPDAVNTSCEKPCEKKSKSAVAGVGTVRVKRNRGSTGSDDVNVPPSAQLHAFWLICMLPRAWRDMFESDTCTLHCSGVWPPLYVTVIGFTLTRLRATISIGTVAEPPASIDAVASRRTIASVEPSDDAPLNGMPPSTITPANASEPGPKKPAGIGVALKFSNAVPPGGVVNKSTP
jgi:hypothetical protein